MDAFNDNNPRYRCCCQSTHVRTGTLVIALTHVIIYAIVFSRCVKVASSIFYPIEATPPSPTDHDGVHHTFRILTSENLTIFDETSPASSSSTNLTAVVDHERSEPESMMANNGTGRSSEHPMYEGGFRDTVPSLSSAMLLLVSVLSTLCLLWAFVKTKSIFVVPEIILIIANATTFLFLVIFCAIALAVDSHELNTFIQHQLRSENSLRDLPETTRFLAKLTAGMGVFVFAAAACVQLWFLRVVRKCYEYLREKKVFLVENPAGVRYFAIDERDADGDDTSAVAIMEPRPTRGFIGSSGQQETARV